MAIEINNLTKFGIDKKSFAQVAKKVLKGENKGTQNISLAFVDKTEIKKLNKKFRKKNKATDVLSFSFDEKDFLGEIVICPEVVKEKGEEIMQVFIHGILHLLGYDHEKSEKEAELMEKKERFYFKKFKN
jgi:probable rRNA maturation factor